VEINNYSKMLIIVLGALDKGIKIEI